MKTKLTQKTIEKHVQSAAAFGSPVYLWDDALSGFGARVSKTGVSFLVQKWAGGRGGKAVRFTIGSMKNGMTLDEARKLAAANIGDISKGENPVDTRRKRRQATRERLNSIRVSEAIDLYIPEGVNSRWKAETRKDLTREFTSAKLLSSPVRELTKADIRRVLSGKSGQAAKRNLFARLQPFFKFLVSEDYLSASPMDGLERPAPVASRDRILSSAEITAFWKASGSMTATWRGFFRLLLLTGQRRDEVAGMRWSELDIDKGLWTIPSDRAKNGKAHIVHLSSIALEIIRELRDLQTDATVRGGSKPNDKPRTPFVFPGARGEGHISGYSKMKAALDKRMGAILSEDELPFVDYRLHDLRRTVASGLAEMGFSTDVADRLLNHVTGSRSGVKGVYQRYEFLPERKEAILAWSERVASI